jgi:cytochrome c oxidase subunit 2
MSPNTSFLLLLGCTLWFLAKGNPWAAAEEVGHLRAKIVAPSIEPTFPAIGTAQRPEGPVGTPNPRDDGLSLFLRNGCGACHTISGTEARGMVGPDLSHVGSRTTIGAGILPNTEEAIARFIARPDLLKPGVKMPAFDMLPQNEIRAIAKYLKALQ